MQIWPLLKLGIIYKYVFIAKCHYFYLPHRLRNLTLIDWGQWLEFYSCRHSIGPFDSKRTWFFDHLTNYQLLQEGLLRWVSLVFCHDTSCNAEADIPDHKLNISLSLLNQASLHCDAAKLQSQTQSYFTSGGLSPIKFVLTPSSLRLTTWDFFSTEPLRS